MIATLRGRHMRRVGLGIGAAAAALALTAPPASAEYLVGVSVSSDNGHRYAGSTYAVTIAYTPLYGSPPVTGETKLAIVPKNHPGDFRLIAVQIVNNVGNLTWTPPYADEYHLQSNGSNETVVTVENR